MHSKVFKHVLPLESISCDLSGSHVLSGLTLSVNYLSFSKCNSIKSNIGTEKKPKRLPSL